MLFVLIVCLFLKYVFLIKWVVVGGFLIFSVYISFFVYYDLLIGEIWEKVCIELVNFGYESLVGEVFILI